MSHIPNESSSNWFKTMLLAEDDEETEDGPETEDPEASLTIGELQKPAGGDILGSIDYTESISFPNPSPLYRINLNTRLRTSDFPL